MAARDRGVLVRALGDGVVLMSPFSLTDEELSTTTDVLTVAIPECAAP